MKIDNKLKWSLITILSLFTLILLCVGLGVFYVKYFSIIEIGKKYTTVFWTDIITRSILNISIFTIAFVLVLFSNLFLRKNIRAWSPDINFLNTKKLMFWISFVISFFALSIVSEHVFSNALRTFHPTWFDVVDPILGKNIGYYMFRRPFILAVSQSIVNISIFFLIYNLAIYLVFYIRNGVKDMSSMLKQKGILTHIIIILLVLFSTVAYRYTLMAESILFAKNGDTIGGGYTQIMIWQNFYRVAPFLLLSVVIISIVLLFKSKIVPMLFTIGGYIAVWIIIGVVALFVQNIIVKPNEASMERPYIRHNIEFTQIAYNLNNIEETEYPVGDTLTKEEVDSSKEVIDNIRITDYNSTLLAYNQLQGLRNYYQFKDIDPILYLDKGVKKLGFVSARELQIADKDDKTTSFVNKRMRYTHGYGIVMSPVNEVTPEGQPKFLLKDIPVTSSDIDINITEPRIYYGETNDGYVIVNSLQEDLNEFEGTSDKTKFDGSSGIKLSFINKLIYAIKYKDINLFTTGYTTSESKILTNRNVVDRVKTVLPFIEVDPDIQIAVTNDGKLKWIVDGYTTSSNFPYSEVAYDYVNYIRNSVKVVVDAYDGSVEAYVVDQKDPIINTYNKIYPNILKFEPLPADLAYQIKYPERLFKIQASIYKKYHTTNPATFYAKSDVWEISREKYGANGEIKFLEPNYNMISVNGEKPELMLSLPFTLANKDNNLVSWLGARSDGVNYGKLISYIFPSGKHVYGTLQVENKIDNDPTISSQISLWDQGGSSVIRGNMLVIPLKNSIIYVEPIYLTSQNQASLPEVKRIVLCYGDTIVMENTLEAALQKLFSLNPKTLPTKNVVSPQSGPNVPDDVRELLNQTIAKFNESKLFMQENDFQNYGVAMKELDVLMKSLQDRMKELEAQTVVPTAPPSNENLVPEEYISPQ